MIKQWQVAICYLQSAIMLLLFAIRIAISLAIMLLLFAILLACYYAYLLAIVLLTAIAIRKILL